MIYKYTYGQTKQSNYNNDPFWLYNGYYGNDINIDTISNHAPEAFVRDNLLQYRNNTMLGVLMGGWGNVTRNSRVVMEVYNDTEAERMSAFEFKHILGANDWWNWWNSNNLLDSNNETSIDNLKNDAPNNNFWGGLWGDDYLRRRWFINKSYNGCQNDPGYLGIPTRRDKLFSRIIILKSLFSFPLINPLEKMLTCLFSVNLFIYKII